MLHCTCSACLWCFSLNISCSLVLSFCTWRISRKKLVTLQATFFINFYWLPHWHFWCSFLEQNNDFKLAKWIWCFAFRCLSSAGADEDWDSPVENVSTKFKIASTIILRLISLNQLGQCHHNEVIHSVQEFCCHFMLECRFRKLEILRNYKFISSTQRKYFCSAWIIGPSPARSSLFGIFFSSTPAACWNDNKFICQNSIE